MANYAFFSGYLWSIKFRNWRNRCGRYAWLEKIVYLFYKGLAGQITRWYNSNLRGQFGPRWLTFGSSYLRLMFTTSVFFSKLKDKKLTWFIVDRRTNRGIQGSFLTFRQGWWRNYHHKGVGHSYAIVGSEPNWSRTSGRTQQDLTPSWSSRFVYDW